MTSEQKIETNRKHANNSTGTRTAHRDRSMGTFYGQNASPDARLKSTSVVCFA